jgi:RNase H-like domain found in reverse transcriptase/Reverse transcriptase (RNA-dependent DNA polymerase)/Integrase zinc binding domain/Retroviral aspartyl protease
MRFSLDAPSIVFANERKYPVSIADDETITIKVPVFDSGTPEAVLFWRKQFNELADIKSLSVKQKFTNVALLLSGEAKEYWTDSKAEVIEDDTQELTNEDFDEVMVTFMTKYFSADAAEDLREYLLNIKKPSTMDFQKFIRRVRELNRYLPFLPPPMNDSLDENELFMVMKKAVPSWHKTFITTGQRQHITTLQELTDYFLGIEEVEKRDRNRSNSNNNPKNRSPSSSNSNSQNRNSNNGSNGNGRRPNSNSNNNNSAATRRNARNYCHRHDTDRHSWYDCRLNPRSANYDPNQPPPRNERNSNTQGNRPNNSQGNSNRSNPPNSSGNGQNNRASNGNNANSNRSSHNYNTRSNSRSNESNYNMQENPQRAPDNRSAATRGSDDDESLYAIEEPTFLDDPKPVPSTNDDSVPELRFKINDSKTHGREQLRLLLDTGASRSIIDQHYLPEGTTVLPDPQGSRTFTTKTGTFTTDSIVHLKVDFPDLAPGRHFKVTFSVDNTPRPHASFAAILGCDMLRQLQIQFDFSTTPPHIKLDDLSIPMKPRHQTDLQVMETAIVQAEQDFNRRLEILPAAYQRADLRSIIPSHLKPEQQNALHQLLQSYADLFAGKLGCLPGEPVTFHLKPDATPYHGKAFPVPKSQYKMLRDEVDRLCKLDVLKQCNDSPWAAPSFGVPKKNGQIRFVSDFRHLNKFIERRPFPLPSIPELLRSLDGFTFCTTLDLNMGYWTIRLSPESQQLCSIILPWGKFQYLRLPMGVSASPDIYQEKMSALFQSFPNIIVYMDDICLLTAGPFDAHLEQLAAVFDILRQNDLQVHADKSKFCTLEAEYLGFILTPNGIKPQPKKVQAILQIAPPTTVKLVRRFMGMINQYKQMIPQRSHLLTPIVKLTQKKAKFEWTSECQRNFDQLKSLLAKQISLAYPDYTRPFHIYTDASKYQLGSVVTQSKQPIAFYSRKLTDPQTRYSVTELELLSIVETLKEFRTILLGHSINIYTDHKNLTYDNFTTDRVRRWRLLIEEYGPRIIYIKGVNNVVADSLSRMPLLPEPTTNENKLIDQLFATNDLFPLAFQVIADAQHNDSRLQQKLRDNPDYEQRIIRKHVIIYYRNKIVVPLSLQPQLLDWYHTFLLHPGSTRMFETISQHFTWNNLSADVEALVRECPSCQRYKRNRKHYGKLPPIQHDPHPWNTIAVDLMGPWTVPQPTPSSTKSSEPMQLLALSIIDPDTHWIELVALPNKESATVALALDHEWLCRYPRPAECIHDNGSEFTGSEFQELLQSYDIQSKPTTVKNPQANAIVERAHQTIGNMLRTSNLMSQKLQSLPALQQLLHNVQWALNTTYHTTLKATPGQLVFHRDLILPTQYLSNWATIRHYKQQQANANNISENDSRIPHEYRLHDEVLIRRDTSTLGKLARPTEGPFRIIDISQLPVNGTVLIDRRNSTERINIRRLLPFFARRS